MSKKIERDYDGTPIQEGTALVPVMCDEFMEKNICINPECIRTIRQGGRSFRVMYFSVPVEWERESRASFNQVQNEALGHYGPSISLSMDDVKNEYDLDLMVNRSAEEEYLNGMKLNETQKRLIRLIENLLKKSPKHACAFILMALGYKGADFANKMGLSHDQANKVRHQVLNIAPDGITSLNQICVSEFKANKSSRSKYYEECANEMLEVLLQRFFN